jgi:beta-phosphoglucomutase
MKSGPLTAAIFDVDGVLLQSPHEQAWRDALVGIADPARFTTAMYQASVAGKPRLDGALAALEALGVFDAGQHVATYAHRKQARLEELIKGGRVKAFPDALRFVEAIRRLGWPMAVASSSKNANAMLQLIRLVDGSTLHDAFSVNVCGRDLRHGKPDPEIFQLAAEELPAGIQAALAGGMTALGVARLHDEAGLHAAHADVVVSTLDHVEMSVLAAGRLCRNPS